MNEQGERDVLARTLIIFSLSALIVISIVVLWLEPPPKDPKFVFNSVLPLLGTWVGTVIAYYFSRSNFTAAASAYKQIASPAGMPEDTPVTAAMIERAKIMGLVQIPAGKTPGDMSLRQYFLDPLKTLKPAVTRIPVVDSTNAIQFIVHSGTLYQLVYTLTDKKQDLTAATLQTLLDDAELGQLVKAFAVVPASATLADAKAKMDTVSNCEDVFVTQSGKATEPILGWITDVTIGSHARV